MSDKSSVVRHYFNSTHERKHAVAKQQCCCAYDSQCQGCENYEPFFKYRKCLYPVCQKGRVDNVFLRKPLKEDIISMKAYQAEQKLQEYRKNPRKALGE